MPTDPGYAYNTSPQPPQIPAVFGFTQQTPDMSGVSAALDQSKAVLTNLQGMIPQAVVSGVAAAAVTADTLAQKQEIGIQSALGNAAGALLNLQKPIANQLVGAMGSSLEMTMPLGVKPPLPDSCDQTPDCVLIKIAAQNGSFDAASSYYLNNGGTYGNPLTNQQIAARQFIQNAVSTVPGAWDQISSLLSTIDTNASAGMYSGVNQGLTNKPSAPPGVGGILNKPVASPGQPTQSIPPGVGGAPPATTLGCSGSALPPLPGTGFGTTPPFMDAVGHPDDSVGAWNIISGDSTKPTCGDNNLCQGLQQVGVASIDAALADPAHSGGLSLGYMEFADAKGNPVTVQATITGSQSDDNQSTYTIHYQQVGGSYSYDSKCSVPKPKPPQPTNTQPPATSSGGQCCPPQTINVTVAGPAYTPGSNTKPSAPCKYDVYCTADGVAYVVKTDDGPRNPDDAKIVSGDPLEWDILRLLKGCDKPDDENKPPVANGAGQGIQDINFGGCNEFGAIPVVGLPDGMQSLSQFLGIRGADGSIWKPFPDAGAANVPKNIANELGTTIATIADGILSIIASFANGSPCAGGQNLVLQATDIVYKFLQNYMGGSLDFLTIPNDQQRHFQCPTLLPSYAEAAAAFIGGQIDEDTLNCWVRADNKRYPEYKTVIDSQRMKLSAFEMATARRRTLVNQADYDKYIRESGYLRDFEPNLIYDLTEQIPPPSDIVRMMVRDSADNALAARFQLDDQFGAKYQGQLKEWGEKQGMPEQYMQYLWRAHWDIPAPGQLANMLHRLSRLPPNDPAFVDQAMIEVALNQQDIAPFWVPKFIAISYNPLTRIDARRAYEIGALGKAELKEAYLNLGYSPDNADTLVEFNDKNIRRTFLRRPEIKQLAAGQITQDEYVNAMKMWGASDYAIDDGYKYAELLRKKDTRTKCIKAIRKRFLSGDLDKSQAAAQMDSQGIQSDVSANLINGWTCEMGTTGKQLSAAQAISLYQDGIINESDFVRRLRNVGYSYDDAVLLIRQQQRKVGIKASKDELAAMRRQEQEQERLNRAIQQQQQRAESADRRAKATAERMRTLKTNREKRLIEAGFKFADHAALNPADGVFAVKSLYNSVLGSMTVTNDEAINAILLAAQSTVIHTPEDLRQSVIAALQEATV